MTGRNDSNAGNGNVSFLFLLAAVCAITVLASLLAYRYDNKYTVSGPQASYGVLQVDERSLTEYPVMMLVEDWEYYSGQLLKPEDFDSGSLLPDEYIYIGYYAGFEAGNSHAPPHGSATYRLVIEIPEQTRTYTLELPEIFSAYRAYINGRLMAAMGDPDPDNYQPETLNRSVSFEAGGSIEIIIAVSDFSHLYSGMVYPPAFGLSDAVSQLLSARFLFRAVLCVVALTIGLLSVLVGVLSRRNRLWILFGLLCLFFVGYIAYPIIKTFFSGYYPFYALENVSFCAMLAAVMLLQRKICGLKDRWGVAFPLFGMLACVASVALHLSLPGGNLNIMYAYSWLISAYEWITAGYLTVTAVHAVRKNVVRSKPILIGIIVFDTALVMDRLLPLFEPIVTGWFPELANFVLVLSIGAFIGKDVAEQFKRNTVLEERAKSMDRLLQMQRTYYPLLQERIAEAKAARHDLRHHFIIIAGFLEHGEYDRLKEYVSGYRTVTVDSETVSYCENEVADILAHFYVRLADVLGISLTLQFDIGRRVHIADADLCALLSNLLENAVEACRRQKDGERFITLLTRHRPSVLTIYMENSSDGVIKNASGFLSSKGIDKTGYGLDSIKAIASRYNGAAEFQYDEATHVFTSTVLLEIL